ncbi:D-alanyl-D-alanine carboxypeptidase family protein [Pasteuria penetrans]|uniref:D-alanyl-D-alanine carboxypeptidase family protein n=1 Tax=Pasteuria penetrans TaxID=86005 RepID=UPI000FC0B2E0|nr:D-alanyl-D-alanine carboxypeptidase family protein [Pasteuria penetrans]
MLLFLRGEFTVQRNYFFGKAVLTYFALSGSLVPISSAAVDGKSYVPMYRGTVARGEGIHVPVSVPDLAPTARSAVLWDRSSGRILYAKRPYEMRSIASITKIMTAVIALEVGNWEDIVVVSPYAASVGGSSAHLHAGDKIPLGSLLYSLLLHSGNDSAVAIAEHVGSSVRGFVRLMNEKLQYLGLHHTHFQNPHGLSEPGHYGSAYDFARIADYALHHEKFRKIVRSWMVLVPWPNTPHGRRFYNRNRLLGLYHGADGVKTGYTKLAGRTLVSSVTRNGRQLIVVLLTDGNRWRDAIRMFEYGFSQ